jgi:hypothetical protein
MKIGKNFDCKWKITYINNHRIIKTMDFALEKPPIEK